MLLLNSLPQVDLRRPRRVGGAEQFDFRPAVQPERDALVGGVEAFASILVERIARADLKDIAAQAAEKDVRSGTAVQNIVAFEAAQASMLTYRTQPT